MPSQARVCSVHYQLLIFTIITIASLSSLSPLSPPSSQSSQSQASKQCVCTKGKGAPSGRGNERCECTGLATQSPSAKEVLSQLSQDVTSLTFKKCTIALTNAFLSPTLKLTELVVQGGIVQLVSLEGLTSLQV